MFWSREAVPFVSYFDCHHLFIFYLFHIMSSLTDALSCQLVLIEFSLYIMSQMVIVKVEFKNKGQNRSKPNRGGGKRMCKGPKRRRLTSLAQYFLSCVSVSPVTPCRPLLFALALLFALPLLVARASPVLVARLGLIIICSLLGLLIASVSNYMNNTKSLRITLFCLCV